MAFEFFRRRQKMVIVIMVVLMVAFLVSFQGIEMLFSPNAAGKAMATTAFGDLTNGEFQQAGEDVELLRLVNFARWPLDQARLFGHIAAMGDFEGRLTYALLLKEAQNRGVKASEGDVSELLAAMRLDSAAIRGQLPRGYREKHLREAIQRWLTVLRSFFASFESAPPSEPQLQHLYRNLSEELDLEIARVDAAALAAKAPEPSDEEIARHFEQYRTATPGVMSSIESFGFGYRQPDRASINYMLVKREPLARVIKPTDDEIRREYRLRERDFPPTTAPAGPGGLRTDMLEKITREVTDMAVDLRLESLLRKIDSIQNVQGPKPSYQATLEQLVRPADAQLATVIKDLRIENQPLERAIEQLAKAAGLKGIAYPWGTFGKLTIEPTVRVSVSGQDITLGDALAKITEQALALPAQPATAAADTQPATAPSTRPATPQEARAAFTWKTVVEVPDCIFAAPGAENVDLLPLSAGQTGLVSAAELADTPIAHASTATRGGVSLTHLAFSAKPFSAGDNQKRRDGGHLDKGSDGPRMYLAGEESGRVLWRLVDAVAAHDPAPDAWKTDQALRKRVIEDVKLVKGFELAKAQAAEIAQRAAKLGLESASKLYEARFIRTEPFSRMSALRGEELQRYYYMRLIQGLPLEELSDRVLLRWNDVPGLAMPSAPLREELARRVFGYAPQEPVVDFAPSPEAMHVIELQSRREVAVVHPVGYRPPVEQEFEQERMMLRGDLASLQAQAVQQTWFDPEAIKSRVGYQPKGQ
jgi:hypothetical protein